MWHALLTAGGAWQSFLRARAQAAAQGARPEWDMSREAGNSCRPCLVVLAHAVVSLHHAVVSLHHAVVSSHHAVVSLHHAVVSLHHAVVSLHHAVVSLQRYSYGKQQPSGQPGPLPWSDRTQSIEPPSSCQAVWVARRHAPYR